MPPHPFPHPHRNGHCGLDPQSSGVDVRYDALVACGQEALLTHHERHWIAVFTAMTVEVWARGIFRIATPP